MKSCILDSEPPNSTYFSFHICLLLLFVSGTGWVVVLLVLLIMCSALISGSEVAYFSLKPKKLLEIKESNTNFGRRILKLKEKPKVLLATILISNNFINIAIVIVSDFLLRGLLSDTVYSYWAQNIRSVNGLGFFSEDIWIRIISFSITVVLVTFILVLIGEVIPKIYASIYNLRFARFMSLPLGILNNLFLPVSSVLVKWTDRIESNITENRGITDKKEIDKAIELAVTQDLSSEEEEVDILKGIIKFGNVTAKQIMKSRVDVIAIEMKTNFTQLMKLVRESGFSRIPVYRDDFDNIEGILYVKDLLGHTEQEGEFQWQPLIRKNVLYIPETKKINELLREFQQKRLHMAIVVDEYGGSSGIVTLEDIMEEVIGEIKDEFDDEEEVEYLKIDDNNYIFEGKTLLNDVCRIIGVETDSFDEVKGDADSIAGLILEIVGHIPKVDREIKVSGFKFKIIASNNRRIEKINVSILPE